MKLQSFVRQLKQLSGEAVYRIEDIFATYLSDKVLVSRMYKNFKKQNKKANNFKISLWP